MRLRPKFHMMALLCLSAPATGYAQDDEIAEVRADHAVSRIAFGSCLRNPAGAEILDEIVAYKPDLFVWLGDNIYVDTMDQPARFGELYGLLGGNPRFRKLRETCPQLAIWDDHDFGADNQGKTYPLKGESKAAFGKFWEIPETSAFWSREGIHRAVEYGPPKRRVQVILLDGRWHLDQANPEARDSYLGKPQWAWLEAVLKRPATIRVIGSGVLVVLVAAGMVVAVLFLTYWMIKGLLTGIAKLLFPSQELQRR